MNRVFILLVAFPDWLTWDKVVLLAVTLPPFFSWTQDVL